VAERAPVVAVLATLDTKGREVEWLCEQIVVHGCKPLIMDVGVMGRPALRADVTREEV